MRQIRLVPLLLVFAPAAAVAQAQSPAPTAGVTVEHAWARASSGKTGAVYLTLVDHDASDRLTGASTPVAAMAELHQSVSEGGVMKMRPVENGLPLAPDQPATLSPGGYHLMLMGLTRPLKAGESFPLTLTFEHAPPQTVQVLVGKAGATSPEAETPGMEMKDMKMGQ
jgi:copper(I)-binding protein